jgi:hypothetical protein
MKPSIKPILTSLFLGLGVCLVLTLSGFDGHQKAKQPNQTLAHWDTVTLPLEGFSTAQFQAQEQANSQESTIRCFAPIIQQNNYEGIDNQVITPQTWRWVRLEHQKPDGSRSIISLRRPNAWLLDIGATAIGKQIYLELPEMGIVGNARITAFAPNHLDTRLWHENRTGAYIDRPITGKFEHQSPVLLWLTCPDLEPIGTTPTHPFWSEDRQQWVRANDLRIGEHLRTQHGQTVLTHKRTEHKPTTVYNLEVYRDHNYLVSSDGILVHNDCGVDGKAPTPRGKSTKQLRKEWEENTGETWPKEPNNPNKDQVVSHIEPLQDGGLDGYPNIEPVPAKIHHQAHKDNGDYSRWAKDRWAKKKGNQ